MAGGSRSLGTLVLDLVARVGGFETDLGRAERIAARKSKEIEKAVSKAFDGARRSVLGYVGGFIAAEAAYNRFIGAIDRADALRDFSVRTGLAVEKLSALDYVAKQTGTSLDELVPMFGKLSKAAAAALDQDSSKAKLFEAIGVTREELGDLNKLIPAVADGLAMLEDGTAKTAIEMELLGKSGNTAREFFALGSKGMAELEERARSLGAVISTDTANAADEFNDKLVDLRAVTAGYTTQLAAEMLPRLSELVGQFSMVVQEGDNAKETAQGLLAVLDVGVVVVGAISDIFVILGTTIGGVAAGMEGLAETASGLISLDWGKIGAGWTKANIGADAAYNAFFPGTDLNGKPLIGKPAAMPKPQAPIFITPQSLADEDRRAADEIKRRRAANARVQALLGEGTGKSGAGGKGNAEAAKQQREAARAMDEQRRAADQFAESLGKLRGEIGGPLKQAEIEHAARRKEIEELADKGKVSADDRREALDLEAQAYRKSTDELRGKFDAMVATLTGPLAEAEIAHVERLKEIEAAGMAAGASADEIAAALKRQTEAHKKNVTAIEDQLNPTKQLIEDMKFELTLIGMTNEQREKAITLRGLDKTATAGQREEIESLLGELQQQQELQDVLDGIQSSTESAFESWVTGAKSAKDAFRDLVDDVLKQIARVLIQKAVAQVFGSVFGGQTEGLGIGGFASGGFTGYGGKYEKAGDVHRNEHVTRSEIVREPGARAFLDGFNAHGMQFLRRYAEAAAPVRGGTNRAGVTNVNNFNYAAPTDSRTKSQAAAAVGFVTQRALQRNS